MRSIETESGVLYYFVKERKKNKIVIQTVYPRFIIEIEKLAFSIKPKIIDGDPAVLQRLFRDPAKFIEMIEKIYEETNNVVV